MVVSLTRIQIVFGIVAVFAIVSVSPAMATTYHVDGDNGNNNNSGLSASSAWRDPWVADTRISSGDTVIIHEKSGGNGIYHNGCNSVISVDTPNSTWVAAPGELVRISQTGDFSTAPYSQCPRTVTIGIGAPNVTIDGFYVWGSIEIAQSGDGAVIQNCDLSGGGDSQGFPVVVRVYGSNTTPGYGSCSSSGANCVNDTDCPGSQTCTGDSSEWTDNVTVRHSRIHDNKPALGQGGTNDTAIITYGASHMVVEFCEFYNTLNSGIKWKDRAYKNTARYNYFHDMPTGVQGDGQVGQDWIRTHHNVFANISEYAIATENGAVNEFGVYNNTFYNAGMNKGSIGWWHSGLNAPVDSYNNLFYFDSGGDFYHWESNYWTIDSFGYVNENLYYSAAGNTDFYVNNGRRGSTLSAWQSWLDSQGAGSNDGDDDSVWYNPGFSNGSGSFSSVDDFKRNSYPNDGRNGAVIGAFDSDSATVGPGGAIQQAGPLPQVQNVRIVN